MIPIFIPSYNRAGRTRTPALLDACNVTGYKIVVRPSQYADYAQYHKTQNLLTLDAEEGLTYAREFIRVHCVKRNQWCLQMDDNLQGFYVCNEKFYKLYDHIERGPGGLTQINRRWDNIIRGPNTDFATFYRVIVEDTIKEAEKRGAVLCGFSVQNSSSMRGPHKFADVKFICGQAMLMKNVGFPWCQITSKTGDGEDFALTAAHLLKFGRVLANMWGAPRKTHYTPGGCGTFEERLPTMITAHDEVMRRYPGLLRVKTRGPKGIERVEGQVRLRLHTLEQVAKWRADMNALFNNKKARGN